MVTPITPTINNQVNTPKTSKASIFYINDIHGQISNMERLKSASDSFDKSTADDKTTKLKFSSGDILLGESIQLNKLAVQFQNAIGINASAIGNHECDVTSKDFVDLTKDAKYKMLGLNIKMAPESPLNSVISKSYIEEKDGEKYGVIGLMPYDLFNRIKHKSKEKEFQINDISTTTKELQQEIDKFKAQGINKIIVLSHTGYKNDIQIAKETSGIDIILGGHSHDLINGIEKDKNLITSKSGEPVIITQGGRDGNYFGILNVEFNQDGVITKAQNNTTPSMNFRKNLPMKILTDLFLGKSPTVGTIAKEHQVSQKVLTEENPNANFIADAIKSELGTDIVIVNSANLRGNFEKGPITERDIKNILPFKNKVTIIKINEKELVDSIAQSAISLTKSDNKPGIFQVSGLKYTLNKRGELLNLKFIDKSGTENTIDTKNPNSFKTYSIAVDDFIAKGGDGFDMLNKYNQPDTIKYEFDKDKLVAEYIQKQTTPIEIKPDGRIQIID